MKIATGSEGAVYEVGTEYGEARAVARKAGLADRMAEETIDSSLEET